MLSTLKPVVEKPLKPLAHALRRVNPNFISLFGLIFPIIFFICIMQEQYAWALFVFIFNGLDLLDGMVARATNKVSAFGGFLDSTIDRFADFTIIAAFGFSGLVRWSIILPLILVTYLISYIRSRIELAAKGQITASVGIMERTERLILLFIGLLLYGIFQEARFIGLNLLESMCIVIMALSIVTIGQRVLFAYQKLR